MVNHINHNHTNQESLMTNKFIYKSSIEALIIVIIFIGIYFLTKNSLYALAIILIYFISRYFYKRINNNSHKNHNLTK